MVGTGGPVEIFEPQTDAQDTVNHPSHYTYGKIECIDFIMDKNLDFALGNAIKYIVRAGHKQSKGKSIIEKQVEDLRKAVQYLEFEINHILEENNANE